MMKITRIPSSIVLGMLLCLALFPSRVFSGTIVDTDDYLYWRQLANTSEQFGAMKASAIAIANQGDGETRDVTIQLVTGNNGLCLAEVQVFPNSSE